jgi:hypothetical protein
MHNALLGATIMNGRVEEFLIVRARKIERALVRKNWTRVHLAEVTGYDERTIRNVLGAKPVREQTVIDICQASGSSRTLRTAANMWRWLGQSTGSIRVGHIEDTRVVTSPIAEASVRRLA